MSSSSPISVPQQKLSDNSDEEMVLFRHGGEPAFGIAFFAFDPTSSNTLVDTTVLDMATLNSCTASVTDLLSENGPRASGRQNKYSGTSRKAFLLTLLGWRLYAEVRIWNYE